MLGLVLMLVLRGGAKKKAQQWIEAARAAGLNAKGTYPLMEMTGRLDGISVEIENKLELTSGPERTDDDGNDRTQTRTNHFCKASASIPVSTGDMQIAEETLFGKLSKLVGAQDIKTGDNAFDKRFMVKASDVDKAKASLSEPARKALLAAEKSLGGALSVTNGYIEWKGGQVKHERAIEIVRQLAATAKAFDTTA